MKQHITTQQLAELNEEQKEKLKEWVSETYIKPILVEDSKRGVFVSRDWSNYVPTLLSIGQMIEFLDEKRTGDDLLFPWWNQFFTWDYGGVDGYEGEFTDVLWEAVKEVLKENT